MSNIAKRNQFPLCNLYTLWGEKYLNWEGFIVEAKANYQ